MQCWGALGFLGATSDRSTASQREEVEAWLKAETRE